MSNNQTTQEPWYAYDFSELGNTARTLDNFQTLSNIKEQRVLDHLQEAKQEIERAEQALYSLLLTQKRTMEYAQQLIEMLRTQSTTQDLAKVSLEFEQEPMNRANERDTDRRPTIKECVQKYWPEQASSQEHD